MAHHKKIDLKDCSSHGGRSMESGEVTILRRAWNKMKGILTMEEVQKKEKERKGHEKQEEDGTEYKEKVSAKDIRNIIVKIAGCSKCSAEDIGKWPVYDFWTLAFQILSDDNFIQILRGRLADDLEDDNNVAIQPNAGLSDSKMSDCLDTALK